DRGGVRGTLRAVATIFRAAAGLDAQQGAALDIAGVMVGAMHVGGTVNQFEQRQIINGLQLLERLHGRRYKVSGRPSRGLVARVLCALCASARNSLVQDLRAEAQRKQRRGQRSGCYRALSSGMAAAARRHMAASSGFSSLSHTSAKWVRTALSQG